MKKRSCHLTRRHFGRFIGAQNRGSALVAVLAISLVLSATLIIVLAFAARHRQLLLVKAEDLQMLYLAESALHRVAVDFHSGKQLRYPLRPRTYPLPLAENDTARVTQFRWGGYTALMAVVGKARRKTTLFALVGKRPSTALQPALMIDPSAGALTVAGDAMIIGDVRTGPEGIRLAPPGERQQRRRQMVAGKIIRSSEDRRPDVDRELLDEIYRDLRSRLAAADTLPWMPLPNETDSLIDLAPGGLPRSYRLPPGFLDSAPPHIRGPGILVVPETLKPEKPLRLSRYVSLLCEGEIRLNPWVIVDQALLYSPGPITVSGTQQFRGQLFSDTAITVTGAAKLSYPSLLTVHPRRGGGSIRIAAPGEVSGTMLLLSPQPSFHPGRQRNKIIIGKGATVNGLVYSGDLLNLSGTINGIAATGRFHFYRSPTDYFNWLLDGTIDRSRLSEQFLIPLFFEPENRDFVPLVE